jgi:hypothetical protein
VLEPVVARYRQGTKGRYFRCDAAFANPDIYEFLEAECYKYTIRLPASAVLQQRIGWLLKRLVGRPSHEVRRFHTCFRYWSPCTTTADGRPTQYSAASPCSSRAGELVDAIGTVRYEDPISRLSDPDIGADWSTMLPQSLFEFRLNVAPVSHFLRAT